MLATNLRRLNASGLPYGSSDLVAGIGLSGTGYANDNHIDPIANDSLIPDVVNGRTIRALITLTGSALLSLWLEGTANPTFLTAIDIPGYLQGPLYRTSAYNDTAHASGAWVIQWNSSSGYTNTTGFAYGQSYTIQIF